MVWNTAKARIGKLAAAAASAVTARSAGRFGGLSRRHGVVSVFLDGRAASVAVVRLHNRVPRVEMTASLALDEDALADPAAAGRSLLETLKPLKPAPRLLVVSVGTELTFERRLALPSMPPDETDAAVMFQADRVLPFPAGEMRVDYAVEAAGASGTRTVVISAVTDDTARAIEAVAAAAGLSLAAIYQGPSALYAAVATKDSHASDTPRAVVYSRRDGIEMALGTSTGSSTSRFVKSGALRAAVELSHTAAAAGIALDNGLAAFASRDLVDQIVRTEAAVDVRVLEAALERYGGADGTPGVVAVAAGALYLEGVTLPNFHESSVSARRRKHASSKRARIGKYAAAGLASLALAVFAALAYWGYVLSLESKAAALAASNAALKEALARADAGRPWTAGRTILLDVLAGVTEAFPRSPQAFVKSLSVAESGKVSVQGKVPGPQAAYDLVAALSKVAGFQNVKLDNGAADSSGGYGFALSFEVEKWGMTQ